MSVNGIDNVTKTNNRPAFAIFFIVFVLIGAFFVLNLFIGIVISNYKKEKERLAKNFLLTVKQKEWLGIELLIYSQKPKKIIVKHANRLRDFILKVI
jgi:multidrug transporter EmrE-like cation transporter